jgi:hypothetical protein
MSSTLASYQDAFMLRLRNNTVRPCFVTNLGQNFQPGALSDRPLRLGGVVRSPRAFARPRLSERNGFSSRLVRAAIGVRADCQTFWFQLAKSSS